MAKIATFAGFGQPARLYAQYAPVVDQMRKLFTTDVEEFLDAVYDRVQSVVPDVLLHENRKKNDMYRRWWLANDQNPCEDHVYVWQPVGDPDVVEPGILRVHAYAWPALRKKNGHVFASLGDKLRSIFPPSCVVSKDGGDSYFTLSIKYGDSADPVGEAAPPVATLLKALFDEEQRLISQQAGETS